MKNITSFIAESTTRAYSQEIIKVYPEVKVNVVINYFSADMPKAWNKRAFENRLHEAIGAGLSDREYTHYNFFDVTFKQSNTAGATDLVFTMKSTNAPSIKELQPITFSFFTNGMIAVESINKTNITSPKIYNWLQGVDDISEDLIADIIELYLKDVLH
jgi:hypothetical protein